MLVSPHLQFVQTLAFGDGNSLRHLRFLQLQYELRPFLNTHMDSGHTFNDTGPRLGNAPSNKSQSGIFIPLTQSLLGTIQW